MQLRSGLRAKMIFGTIGIVLILGIFAVTLVKTVVYKKLHSKLEKRGISIARHIAENSIDPVLTEKLYELEMMFKDYKASEDDIEYIFAADHHGNILAHTFEGGFPVELKTVNRNGTGKTYSVEPLIFGEDSVHDIAFPLIGGQVGAIHLGISENQILKDINDVIGMVVGIIVLSIIIGSVFAAGFAARITKPLIDLSKAVKAVAAGDLGFKADISSKDEIGDLVKAFNVMVEARKQAEEKLRSSEKKLMAITSNIAEGILVLDEKGMLVFMNPEAEKLLGWTSQELSSRDLHSTIHFHRSDGTPLLAKDCPNCRVFGTGERSFSEDELFVHKTGKQFAVSSVSAPIIEDGRVTAVVIAFRDITERKEVEKEREELISKLQIAVEKIRTLRGMLPICAWCKKIRDDKGYWHQVESYMSEHSDAEFSHGICPECLKNETKRFEELKQLKDNEDANAAG